VVHPQEWPEHVDYADKKVVVIGSGHRRDVDPGHRCRIPRTEDAAALADLLLPFRPTSTSR